MSLIRNNQALLLLKPEFTGGSNEIAEFFQSAIAEGVQFQTKLSNLTARLIFPPEVDKIRHFAGDKICLYSTAVGQIEKAVVQFEIKPAKFQRRKVFC